MLSGFHWNCSSISQISDQILDEVVTSDLESCQSSCLLSLDCKSIAFDSSDSSCQRIKTSIGDTSGTQIAISGTTTVGCELGITICHFS